MITVPNIQCLVHVITILLGVMQSCLEAIIHYKESPADIIQPAAFSNPNNTQLGSIQPNNLLLEVCSPTLGYFPLGIFNPLYTEKYWILKRCHWIVVVY